MPLVALWYAVLAAMLIAYVVLDGFDFGAGIVHLFVARDEVERAATRRAIGPFWDGNEVWLIAAGGVLFFAFPAFYAAALSGFYLALMLFLWLLILRALSLELRGQLRSPLWRGFWDRSFGLASLAIAFLLGVALGNIVRGVRFAPPGAPEAAATRFFAPLWTDWLPGPDPGLLDGFTVLLGLTAVAALGLHGAAWVILKSADEPPGFHARLRRFQSGAAAALAVLAAASLISLGRIRAGAFSRLLEHPAWLVLPALALLALLSQALWLRRRAELASFLASSAAIAAMLAATAVALYPTLLPSVDPAQPGLVAAAAASPEPALRAALCWWPLGAALAIVYFVLLFRVFRGKLAADGGGYEEH